MDRPTIVIGAGISGLACALGLARMGVAVRVLEAADRPGGVISTVRRAGFLFESGPQSLQLTPELREFIRQAGCASQLMEADPRSPRYVVHRGRLRPAPLSPPALLTTPLLGMGSKMRVLSEAFRRSQPVPGDESLADFVRRKFGTEILEQLAGPFVSGVFAGDPEKLSLRSAFPALAVWEEEYGSIVRGAIKSRGGTRPTLASFREGMGTLVHAAAGELGSRVIAGAAVDSIQPGAHQRWTIHSAGAQPQKTEADALVLATPAHVATRLLAPVCARLASTLAGIPYAPVAVVSLGYRREHVGNALDGFGFLVPRTEKLRTLGTIWNSSLFPGRCPEGTVLLTSFLGGATDPQVLAMDDEQIVKQADQELSRVLRIKAPPMARQVWRHRHGLPQYNLGHAQKIAALGEDLAAQRGLFLAGNYLEGPSMGSSVSQGFRAAQSVRDYLGS